MDVTELKLGITQTIASPAYSRIYQLRGWNGSRSDRRRPLKRSFESATPLRHLNSIYSVPTLTDATQQLKGDRFAMLRKQQRRHGAHALASSFVFVIPARLCAVVILDSGVKKGQVDLRKIDTPRYPKPLPLKLKLTQGEKYSLVARVGS